MKTLDHLGGHTNKCNLDRGMLSLMISKGCKTFLDVGCGTGGMVKAARDMGMTSAGIEGDSSVEKESKDIIIHDFASDAKLETPIDGYDVVYSCEFLEHIAESTFTNRVSGVFAKATKLIVMCAAPPGWGGHHHVNEQSHEYWIKQLNSIGYEHSPELTRHFRLASTMNTDRATRKQFMKHRCLVFVPMNTATRVDKQYSETNVPNMKARHPNGVFHSTIPNVRILHK